MTVFLKENFRDADGLLYLLAKHYTGTMPQRAAVLKWFRRGSVPGGWVLVLMAALQAESGTSPDLSAHLGGKQYDIFA